MNTVIALARFVAAGWLASGACAAFVSPVAAQTTQVSVTIRVVLAGEPVDGARVSSGQARALTNAAGEVSLRLQPGLHVVLIEKQGLEDSRHNVTVQEGRDTTVVLVVEEEALEHEAILVTSTRGERRIEDEPVRVEVVSREEVEEKLLMTPGDISMLLNETAGLRVQPTAPSLGGAGVRIQGLRGRYTQILSDGLPLYGAQTGALGPLQIPPMDLAQVEVIKGAASALYGASALGGVVNLISRRPEERDRELLVNQSTLGGTDAILWSAQQLDQRWGYTLLASGHRQAAADVDDDGWADVPSFRRALLRPRLFWRNQRGASVLLTAGGMIEDREGGMIDGRNTPAGTPFREALDTRQLDAGLVASVLVAGSRLLSVRGSGVLQRHEHDFGGNRERDLHATAFTEAALSGTTGPHTWVIGAAIQHEDYTADDVAGFDYTFTVPGLFIQDEYAAADWLRLAGSARLDRHNRYGSFLSPRLSLLVRPAEEWTVRASGGTGYFAPTPWIEETEAVGLGRLAGSSGLEAERARSASLDVARTFGAFELNATAFGSEIRDAVQARRAGADSSMLELFNAEGRVRTHGTELLVRYHLAGIHVTATHVFMRSTEPDPESGSRREVPLTPRHAAGLVAAWEQEGRGRVAVEFYFTGRQELDDNPYRDVSVAHVITGLLVERRFGPARVFLNAENLLDTRQTRHDPLLLSARSGVGRWITEAWGPLEGRSFNAGVRWTF